MGEERHAQINIVELRQLNVLFTSPLGEQAAYKLQANIFSCMLSESPVF